MLLSQSSYQLILRNCKSQFLESLSVPIFLIFFFALINISQLCMVNLKSKSFLYRLNIILYVSQKKTKITLQTKRK